MRQSPAVGSTAKRHTWHETPGRVAKWTALDLFLSDLVVFCLILSPFCKSRHIRVWLLFSRGHTVI
jgi:hypothetical protein